MPEPLIVNRKSTIADVEFLIRELKNSPEDRDLLLPNWLDNRELGGTIAMIQLIATWSHTCPRGRVRVHVQDDDEPDQVERVVDRFLTLDHGFLASQLSDEITNRNGRRSLRSTAHGHIKDRLRSMDQVESARRGSKVLLAAVDGTVHDRPPTLYQPSAGAEPEVRTDDGFHRLAEELQKAIRIRTRGDDQTEVQTEDLSRLLHELFSNTHTWARQDALNKTYEKSVRGIRIEGHNLNAREIAAAVGQQATVAAYMERARSKFGDRQHMVELSVFDCGPGLAARQLSPQGVLFPSVTDEITAIDRCLSKHFTTSNEETKGQGLHRVLQTISELKGFLTLRTGHLRLYRDFIENPYRPEDGNGTSLMQAWNPDEELTELAMAAGAFYTLLYPVPYDV